MGELRAAQDLQSTALEVLEFDKILERLASYAVSQEGRQFSLALRPYKTQEQAEKAQEATKKARELLFYHGDLPLQGLHAIKPLVKKAQIENSMLSAGEVLKIASFLKATARLSNYAQEAKASPDPAEDHQNHALLELLEDLRTFPRLLERLERSILNEQELSDEASSKLAKIRSDIRAQQGRIRRSLEKVLKTYKEYLQEELITQRQGRFVLPVKAGARAQVPGIVHDSSQSGQTLFIEPLMIVEQNNRLRELVLAEEQEIERILRELTAELAKIAPDLLANISITAEIDFLAAKVGLAQELEAVPALFNSQKKIELYGARHPGLSKEEVVPIDIYLGEEFSTLLITGPNTGGKTVGLKTLGLLSLMGMSGLQIPAKENSRLCFFEQVLADIGDEQSIEQSLSTFSASMRNVVAICQQVTDKSLVLLDELCSGTDPQEGAALAIAILEYLYQQGALSLATTHYQELKLYALESPHVENAASEFDAKTLEPTYRLLIGVAGSSQAFAISSRLGLAPEIIEEAQTYLTAEHLQLESLLQEAEADRLRALDLQEEAEAKKQAAQQELRHLEQERARLNEQKYSFQQETRGERRRALKQQEKAIDQLIESMRESYEEGQFKYEEALELRGLIREDLRETEAAIGAETLKHLKEEASSAKSSEESLELGSEVYVPSLNLTGKIMTKPDSKGQVQVSSGALQVNVPLSSLQLATAKTPPETKMSPQQELASNKRSFKSELKLLGLSASEASHQLDLFLDQAVLAGAGLVRIIHGKGTGVLRQVVADFLSQDPRVASYELAQPNEGGAGVTLASLK